MRYQNYMSYFWNYRIAGRLLLRWQRIRGEIRLKKKQFEPDNPLHPPLIATARMKELVSRHYLEGRYVNGVKKVAWVTSGAPIEILRALDFFILYPEKHAAICGARKQSIPIAAHAERAGFSPDICSYARTDIGSVLSGRTPVGKLPRPDLLLACTNICQTVLFWYRVLAEYFQAPLLLVDTPFLHHPAQPHHLKYVKQQLEEMIPVLEQISGKRLDYHKLQHVVSLSKEAAELWWSIIHRAKVKPSPITAFDTFIHLAPIVDQRGKASTIDYYRVLLREVDRRIEAGIGAVKEEKRRVLWDNLPIWFKIREHAQKLARHGVNVVIATYSNAWGELAPLMNPDQPLESIARVYLHPILNRSALHKLQTMITMIREFQLDGAILHSDRSCKPYSLGQVDQREKLVRETGIPALLLDADHNDPRAYSEEQIENRLEAFIESLYN